MKKMRRVLASMCLLVLAALLVVPSLAQPQNSTKKDKGQVKVEVPEAQALEMQMRALKDQILQMEQGPLTPEVLAQIKEMETRLTQMQKEFVQLTNPGGGGQGEVAIPLVGPPPNDNCASAITATCPLFTDTQDTTLATNEVGEPNTTCGSTVNPQQSHSVWYKLTPTTQNVIVSTAGSTYDTVIQVYTGTCGSFTPVVCDDDCGGELGLGLQSQVQFVATAGVTFLIKVASFSTSPGGTLIFSLTCTPVPPANDSCSKATAVTLDASGRPFQECIDTTNTTLECFEVKETCVSSDGASVWYKVTAPAKGFLVLGTLGGGPTGTMFTNYDTVISVYNTTSCLPSSSKEIACNDDVTPSDRRSLVKVPVAAGPVLVRIAGFGGAKGTLCVRFAFSFR